MYMVYVCVAVLSNYARLILVLPERTLTLSQYNQIYLDLCNELLDGRAPYVLFDRHSSYARLLTVQPRLCMGRIVCCNNTLILSCVIVMSCCYSFAPSSLSLLGFSFFPLFEVHPLVLLFLFFSATRSSLQDNQICVVLFEN